MSEPANPQEKKEEAKVTSKDFFEDLLPCFEMSLESGNDFLLRKAAKKIYLAGPHWSGKSGIIAGLYLRFKDGPLGKIEFGGSLTLQGLERRAHPLTQDSQREEGILDRDKNPEEVYYHFRLAFGARKNIHEFLISDISGEELKNIAANKTFAEKHSCIRSCDHFVFTIDGEAYMNPLKRAATIDSAKILFRRLVTDKLLTKANNVQILLTKADLMAANDSDIEALIEPKKDLQNEFDEFREYVARLDVYVVAVHPKANPQNYGARGNLIPLLEFWTKNSRTPYLELPEAPSFKIATSEFLRFQSEGANVTSIAAS